MIEIKFRAWDKSRNRFFTCARWVEFRVNKDGVLSAKNLERGGGYVELPIQQFTGLHDKNGKEIYEGDILRYNDKENCNDPLFLEVIFNQGCFQVTPNPFRGGYDGNLYEIFDDDWTVKVIGNIHENPELLK